VDFRELQEEYDVLSCGVTTPALIDSRGQGPYKHFEDGTWRCPICGEGECDRTVNGFKTFGEFEAYIGRLSERTFFSPEVAPAVGHLKSTMGEVQLVTPEFAAKVLDLALVVWRTLGFRHWASQWARLIIVDLCFAVLEFARPACYQMPNQRLIVMIMGTLNRLWDWMASLGLAQDPSCFLRVRASHAIRLAEAQSRHLDSHGHEQLLELGRRVEKCNKQVDILPLKPLIISGSVNFG